MAAPVARSIVVIHSVANLASAVETRRRAPEAGPLAESSVPASVTATVAGTVPTTTAVGTVPTTTADAFVSELAGLLGTYFFYRDGVK